MLTRQLLDLGERTQAIARRMQQESRVPAQHLADLQAVIAELTDAANELAQYAGESRG